MLASTTSSLRSFVKTVCVSGTHPEPEDPPTSTLDAQDISNIISAFPSLHSIRLEFIRIRSAKEEELSQLELEYCAPLNIDGMMDQQKRLHLQSFQAFACTFIGTDLRHILCLFSSINTLDLVESRIIVDEDLDTVITPTFPILKPQIRTYLATPNSLPNTATLLQSSNFSKSLLGLELHCENLVFFALECVSLIKPAIFPRLEELKFNFCGEPLAFFGDDDRAEHHAKLMMLVVSHLLDGNRKLKYLTFSFPVPLRLKKESMDSNYLEEMDLSPIPDFLIIPLAAIPLILSFHLGLEAIIDGLRSNMLRPYNPPPLEMIGFKMKFSTIISSSSSRPTSYGEQELRQLGDPAMQYLKDSFEWQNIIDVLLKLETLRRINVTGIVLTLPNIAILCSKKYPFATTPFCALHPLQLGVTPGHQSENMQTTVLDTRSTTSLAQEIIDYIIDFLHCDRETLLRTSIVAKRWTHASQYHIFTRIIRDLGKDDNTTSDMSITQFLEFFESHPHIRPFVKVAVICGTKQPFTPQYISRITSGLPFLHSIHLIRVVLNSAKEEELLRLQLGNHPSPPTTVTQVPANRSRRPHLRSLEISGSSLIGADFRHIFCLFSSIETLTLWDCDVVLDENLAQPLNPTCTMIKPRIRAFTHTTFGKLLPNSRALLMSSNTWDSLRKLKLPCPALISLASHIAPLIVRTMSRLEELVLIFNSFIVPDLWPGVLSDEEERRRRIRSFSHLLTRCPKLKSLQFTFELVLHLKLDVKDASSIPDLGRPETLDLSETQGNTTIPYNVIPLLLSFSTKPNDTSIAEDNKKSRYSPPPQLETIGFKFHIHTLIPTSPTSSPQKPNLSSIAYVTFNEDHLRQFGDTAGLYLKDMFQWKHLTDAVLPIPTLKTVIVEVRSSPEQHSIHQNGGVPDPWLFKMMDERRKLLEDNRHLKKIMNKGVKLVWRYSPISNLLNNDCGHRLEYNLYHYSICIYSL
ncbi:hypothetical protein ABKN59_003320 [Abortiporus biennis]